MTAERLPQEWARAARRPALYGVAILIVAAGARAHSYLAGRAAEAAAPFERVLVRSGTLARSRLYDILARTGSSPSEASSISGALGKAANARGLRPEDGWRIERSTSGVFRHLTLSSGPKRIVVVRRDGRYRVSVSRVPLSTIRNRRWGAVHGSVWASMEAEGIPPQVIAGFTDALRWTVDFLTETRDGDRFAVLWREERLPEGRVVGRTILTGIYEGTEAGRNTAVLFDGTYYDAEGDSLKRMFLRAPLRFTRIASHFSKRRFHPVLKRHRHHTGTDYAAPKGTPVVSVADGTVVFAGRDGGYGNVVRVRHAGAYSTSYAHLSRFAARARRGRPVKQGQVVGFVGSTGLSTGPHLHFEIEENGRPRNFLKLRLPFARAVDRDRLSDFRAVRDRRRAELDAPSATGGRAR
ncbi:MAG: peptidoglycan DD-metalloendopeptidase family protein [Elusimicrobia bacterium]|nr:peptidoglycan DD-metalloendopeptidase family protein [Elusimicrobiota bacterium]